MNIYVSDQGRPVATIMDGKLYPSPGLDRDALAFELFKLMLELTREQVGVSATWGSNWRPTLGGTAGAA